MSAAILWVGLPILLGAALLLLRRASEPLTIALAVGASLILAWIAWQVPLDTPNQLGPFTLRIFPSFSVFGRSFIFTEVDRALLTLTYTGLSLWLAGSVLAQPGRLFVPSALMLTGLLVAAYAVEPFLYAAPLVAVAVLISVPMLAPPGSEPGPGVFRYVSFQMLAVPFILFTGWLLSGVEASPGNLSLTLRAAVLLGVGLIFLMSVVPFHSWIPMVANESHPYAASFVFLYLPTLTAIFALAFSDRYAWLRDRQLTYELFLMVGNLVVLLGGLWVASQRRLRKMLAYAVVIGIGSGLQAIGLGGSLSVEIFFALLIPRGFAIWIWAVALSAFEQVSNQPLALDNFRPLARRHPLLTIAMLAAIFSLAGLPILAGFPPALELWGALGQVSGLAVGAALLGSLGLGVAALRLAWARLRPAPAVAANASARPETEDPGDLGNPYAWFYFVFSLAVLLLIGLAPRLFLGDLADFAAIFPQIGP